VRDARGFTYSGALYDPAEALADEDLGLANLILTNGARLYVDHAHPEYSTPEVTNPRDLVLWDKAGERVMAEAARRAATVPTVGTIHLYKNNTDNKGASYVRTRTTSCGGRPRSQTSSATSRRSSYPAGVLRCRSRGSRAGRLQPGFQLSQRADYFEVEVGLETTLSGRSSTPATTPRGRGQVPPAHVIIGDANLSEVSTYLKVGTTSIVLSMIEAKALSTDLAIADPVAELKAISHDPTLAHLIRLRDGRRLSALDLQWAYFERARAFEEAARGRTT
jgi:proteasome accessory factor A